MDKINIKLLIFLFFLTGIQGLYAQKAEREYIRKGNRQFNDTAFVDAEINYRKAIEANPKSATAIYNLGNALSAQDKLQDAMDQYQTAVSLEKDKNKLAKSYHNAGVIFQAGQDYEKSIEMYKQALRNNPHDDETRYNLALAQKMLKDQQNDQDQQDQNQEQNQDENNDQNNEEQQNQDQQQNQQDQQQDQNDMSRENAEQLLNAVMQDEKEVQDKVKKQQVIQGRTLEKNW